MASALFAKDDMTIVWIIGGVILLFFGGIVLIVFFSFIRLWVQSLLTGAKIGLLDLVGMKLRNVDYVLIVRCGHRTRRTGDHGAPRHAHRD